MAVPPEPTASLPPAALAALRSVLTRAGSHALGPTDRLLIISDLHLGNGGRKDDFLRNSGLMTAALRDYYLRRGYGLVLNGDIEELQRFDLAAVRRAWRGFYALLEEFARGPGLHRIFGNHDLELSLLGEAYPADQLHEGLRLTMGENSLLVFHGHQASLFISNFLALTGIVLRYIATPLGIRAYSTSQDSRKKYRVEQRVYAFSAGQGIVSLIGHTHRPLFESLSKLDSLKFRIEALCRRYPQAPPQERETLAAQIRRSREELEELYERGEYPQCTSALYNNRVLVPCLFNSGCAVGKRGFTALEIREGRIALVHWFDRNRGERYLHDHEEPVEHLGDSDYYRVLIKEEPLDYVFTRIRLLT